MEPMARRPRRGNGHLIVGLKILRRATAVECMECRHKNRRAVLTALLASRGYEAAREVPRAPGAVSRDIVCTFIRSAAHLSTYVTGLVLPRVRFDHPELSVVLAEMGDTDGVSSTESVSSSRSPTLVRSVAVGVHERSPNPGTAGLSGARCPDALSAQLSALDGNFTFARAAQTLQLSTVHLYTPTEMSHEA